MKQSKVLEIQKSILDWYEENQRVLPWRREKNPYKIWISEIMLQQTTIQAVVPYFERFIEHFPTVQALANAPEKEVLKLWAGLGYYSRARNLHKAARQLQSVDFPKSFEKLIQYPGFGEYTARAVTSIAFDENVGVVDGNVIRFFSRLLGEEIEWWKTSGRKKLQTFADTLVRDQSAGKMNQAFMDIGSVICRVQSPACLLCPVQKNCTALNKNSLEKLPLKKKKREVEFWTWKPLVSVYRKKLAMTQEPYTPFLRGQWLPPGQIKKTIKPPKNFDFRHSITHHDIYIQVKNRKKEDLPAKALKHIRWVKIAELSEHNPSSILKKLLASATNPAQRSQ